MNEYSFNTKHEDTHLHEFLGKERKVRVAIAPFEESGGSHCVSERVRSDYVMQESIESKNNNKIRERKRKETTTTGEKTNGCDQIAALLLVANFFTVALVTPR